MERVEVVEDVTGTRVGTDCHPGAVDRAETDVPGRRRGRHRDKGVWSLQG